MTNRRARLPNFSTVMWLTCVWVLLWGEVSAGNVASGILIAFAIFYLFPLPRLTHKYRLRPLAIIVLVTRFWWDVLIASLQVARLCFSRRQPRSGVVRIELRSHNDMYLTAVAGLTSLVPGSVAVEALKFSGVLYTHVLDAGKDGDAAAFADFRLAVLAQEERLLRAIASDDELLDAGYDLGWRCQGPTYYRPGTTAAHPAGRTEVNHAQR
ncbi:MAG: Na+/H+ antiporter subunit E [Bowdeniella nasicola]|nr:Na+/H+ antiporter subunit E [Bowdeniella nasicola]